MLDNFTKDHKGVGDTVAEVARRLAIDKVADAIAKLAGKEDCGCKQRQDKLNELFPYKKNLNSEQTK
jgi:hypothetical protein